MREERIRACEERWDFAMTTNIRESYKAPTAARVFASLGGTITSFDVPGSTLTNITGVNDAGVVVGYYRSGSIDQHGFPMKADGSITLLDAPGATETIPSGINTSGEISGSENALNGVYQGFVVSWVQ